MAGFFVAALTAGILTLLDLDRTFYIPSATPQKVLLYLWWWGFVVANGVLAGTLYAELRLYDPFSAIQEPVGAFAVGLSYLAILRLKFSTFTFGGKDVPFGVEAFYNAIKEFVYKRINRIALAARIAETFALANNSALAALASQVRLSIDANQLLGDEDKRTVKGWLLQVLQDAGSSELDKKAALAAYVLSGARPSSA